MPKTWLDNPNTLGVVLIEENSTNSAVGGNRSTSNNSVSALGRSQSISNSRNPRFLLPLVNMAKHRGRVCLCPDHGGRLARPKGL